MKYLMKFNESAKVDPYKGMLYELSKVSPDVNEVNDTIHDTLQEYYDQGIGSYLDYGYLDNMNEFHAIGHCPSEDDYESDYNKSKNKEYFKSTRYGHISASLYGSKQMEFYKGYLNSNKKSYQIRIYKEEAAQWRDHKFEVEENYNDLVNSAVNTVFKTIKRRYSNSKLLLVEYFDYESPIYPDYSNSWVKVDDLNNKIPSHNIIIVFTVEK